MFPGKRNNLDALSDRFGINTKHRVLHGALLDAEILADVYLLMSGGQAKLNLSNNETGEIETGKKARKSAAALTVIRATEAEEAAHYERLKLIKDNLWQS
jgi:DNA polymerase-3 subunit epsilon